VENHPKYLTVNRPDHLNIRAQVSAITYGLSNIEEMITPLKILQQKLSREEIISRQKREYAKIYDSCLKSDHSSMIILIQNNNKTFALAEHLLLVEGKDKSGAHIVIPPKFCRTFAQPCASDWSPRVNMYVGQPATLILCE
jgi:hypothetical protein